MAYPMNNEGEHNRGMYLQLGLFAALVLTWLVLEWVFSPQQPRNKHTVEIEMDVLQIDMHRPSPADYRYQALAKSPVDRPTLLLQQAEHLPRFVAHPNGLQPYVRQHMRYPQPALQAGIQGRVLVLFWVDTLGLVQRPQVVRSVHPWLDAEALRLVRSLPAWQPGRLSVEASTPFVLPVGFVAPTADAADEHRAF